ncbi:MAG TPA: wax ester/triacylglycerol synthase family O-acyltransferase, partial [Burkholderiaceae bacterium]|nr:wax ester/triacylglycerol synthase family O-acyltransferase [Burkholderiaceae bacterium]
MKTLSSLDASFLYLETPEMPMHVGSLAVYELPAGFKGSYVRELRRHIGSRLPILPAMRRRLWWMPLNLANPAWVDAEPDLEHHIVEVKLPKSARSGDGMAQLEAQVAALHPVLLDRSRPLWRFYVLEGLGPSAAGRRRVAVYTQLHHAAVDGQAAVALANAILDVTPQPRAIEARPSTRTKQFRLGMGEALRGALASEIQQVSNIVKELPATLSTLGSAAGAALKGSLVNSVLFGGKGGSGNVALAPKTPFNASVTTGRAFAGVSLPLGEIKRIGKAHGATINDMVLMVMSGALRRYLAKRRALPRKSLIATVPVSLRASGDTTSDNQASLTLVSLGTHIGDPMQRLQHICAATAAMKSTFGSVRSIVPLDFPSIGLPWLIEAATLLYGKAKIADRIPQVANLAISNVPGPPMPLYLAGARMLSNYPTSIVTHGLGLNVTVQSYAGSLDFGIMADAAAMPDVAALARAVEVSFDDLLALPPPHDDQASRDAPAALVGRAVRSVSSMSSRVGDAVKGAVGGAMTSAVDQVVRGALRAAGPGRRPAPARPAPEP